LFLNKFINILKLIELSSYAMIFDIIFYVNREILL